MGWLVIDIFTIIPFDLIIPSSYKAKDGLGLVRIGRLYRLLKTTRLLRSFKLIYQESAIVQRMANYVKLGSGIRRLLLLIVILLIF